MSVEGDRGRRVAARHGNIVSHEPASDSSTVQNVLGFIQDYVPQAVTGAKVEKKEKVLWAHFETAPLNELGRWPNGGGGGGGGEGRGVPDTRQGDPLLLIVGVASGFSVWHIPPAGDAREVYCCYGDGETARTARLVPTPDPCLQGSDQFAHLRPILAVVKKGRLGGGSVPYSTLQLLSLSATDADTLVKKFQFKGKPILGLHSNQRVLVVVFRKRVLVIDSSSLAMRFYIKNDYPLEHVVNPVTLGSRWLALTETKLNARYSSRGGVCLTQLHSVTTTVIKNVRKGLSAISDTISGLTGMVQSNPDPSDSPPQTAEHLTANVVTVLDTSYDHPEELRLHEAGRKVGGVVAHFQGTAEHGSHIAALTFDPSGTLLVAASTEGHLFNVFRLVPHPWLSSKSAVTHLYTLFRGATSASVHDIAVSCDSRWVAVSTLNGTSHLFPITPYGGEINVRTHTRNKVVNRMSRFHTSAGIETVATRTHSHSAVTPPPSTVSSSPTSHTSHSPPHHERDLLTSPPRPLGWNNPRTTPPSLPLTVRALYQIKQPYLSSDEGSKVSVGVASGGGGHAHSSPHSSAGEPWPGESQCVRVLFSPSSSSSSASPSSSSGSTSGAREWSSAEVSPGSAVYTVFVLGGSGTLTRYSLLPRPHEEAREGDDAPIALDCHAHFSWRLLGKPHPLTMKLPLPEDNPLISASAVQRTRSDAGEGEREEEEKGRGAGEWLSEVELVTHATPTRRLWMGPQFSFKTYHSHTTLPVSSTRQTGLSESGGTVVPATANLISLSPDSSHQRLVSAESGESAVLSPSHDTLLSDLFQQPPELTSLTTSPIPMPPRPGSHSRDHGMEPGSHSMERGMVEVYGSWNKMAPRLEASQTTDVAEQLAEAMCDHTLSSPPTQPQITTATRKSMGTKTGFHTASDCHQ